MPSHQEHRSAAEHRQATPGLCGLATGSTVASTSERSIAAISGVVCAIAFFSVALPPAATSQSGPLAERIELVRIMTDGLRVLTGFAASTETDPGSSSTSMPTAGIRN